MPCTSRPFRIGQTARERIDQVKAAVDRLSQGLTAGRIKAKVGPQGAIAFEGFTERDGVTDACAYRRLMVQGSASARAAVARAEQLAGRSVNKETVTAGVHSHDGGTTWHEGH
jgi:hypothetical protein